MNSPNDRPLAFVLDSSCHNISNVIQRRQSPYYVNLFENDSSAILEVDRKLCRLKMFGGCAFRCEVIQDEPWLKEGVFENLWACDEQNLTDNGVSSMSLHSFLC